LRQNKQEIWIIRQTYIYYKNEQCYVTLSYLTIVSTSNIIFCNIFHLYNIQYFNILFILTIRIIIWLVTESMQLIFCNKSFLVPGFDIVLHYYCCISKGINAPQLYAPCAQFYFYKGCVVGERHSSVPQKWLLDTWGVVAKVATTLTNNPLIEQGTQAGYRHRNKFWTLKRSFKGLCHRHEKS